MIPINNELNYQNHIRKRPEHPYGMSRPRDIGISKCPVKIDWACRHASPVALSVHLVVKHLKTAIRHQNLRHTYALGGLVVLQNCGDDARQCKGGAVERVAQLNLLVLGAAESAVQAVCLIALEVGHRTNLKPTLLGCRPCLEIDADA